jgi:hypothetical protein
MVTLAILELSVTLVLATAATDSELVSARADQGSVDLGRPFAWIHQDQTAYDPPLPAHLGAASPWENPTHLSGTAFLLDVLVVFALTALVVASVSTLRSGRRAVRRPSAEDTAQTLH